MVGVESVKILMWDPRAIEMELHQQYQVLNLNDKNPQIILVNPAHQSLVVAPELIAPNGNRRTVSTNCIPFAVSFELKF